MSELLTCTVAGRIKDKAEIDLVREEFEDHGVRVLGMEKGNVLLPKKGGLILPCQGFNPLPSEIAKPLRAVEDGFLSCIRRSHFAYFVSFGDTVSMEFGFALAEYYSRNFSLYSRYPIPNDADIRPELKVILDQILKTGISIPEITKFEKEKLFA